MTGEDSETFDLISLQAKVNETRDYYLEQEQLYDETSEEDERRIVEDYLVKFCDDNPDRSEIAKNTAASVIAEIGAFRSTRADLSSKILTARFSMDLFLGALQTFAIQEMMDGFNRSAQEFLDRLRGDSTGQVGESVDLKAVIHQINRDAFSIGNEVAHVQQLAGDIINVRRETLQSIRKGYLTVTFWEALQNMAEHLANTPKDEIVERSWNALAEAVAEIIEYILEEEIPTARVRRMLEALSKAIGMRKAQTEPGNTDQMQNLLPLLLEGRVAIEELNSAMDQIAEMHRQISERVGLQDAR